MDEKRPPVLSRESPAVRTYRVGPVSVRVNGDPMAAASRGSLLYPLFIIAAGAMVVTVIAVAVLAVSMLLGLIVCLIRAKRAENRLQQGQDHSEDCCGWDHHG